MPCSATLTQSSSCDGGFARPTNQQSLQGLWLRLSLRLWLPVATAFIPASRGERWNAFKGKEDSAKVQYKGVTKRVGRKMHSCIWPFTCEGKMRKKFMVQIHLPSMRAVGEGTYCTLHIHACVMQGAEGSTLASRCMLVHISYVQLDGWRLGRTSYLEH